MDSKRKSRSCSKRSLGQDRLYGFTLVIPLAALEPGPPAGAGPGTGSRSRSGAEAPPKAPGRWLRSPSLPGSAPVACLPGQPGLPLGLGDLGQFTTPNLELQENTSAGGWLSLSGTSGEPATGL